MHGEKPQVFLKLGQKNILKHKSEMMRTYSQVFHAKQHEPTSKTKTNIDTESPSRTEDAGKYLSASKQTLPPCCYCNN